jgi:hypothetical protein
LTSLQQQNRHTRRLGSFHDLRSTSSHNRTRREAEKTIVGEFYILEQPAVLKKTAAKAKPKQQQQQQQQQPVEKLLTVASELPSPLTPPPPSALLSGQKSARQG